VDQTVRVGPVDLVDLVDLQDQADRLVHGVRVDQTVLTVRLA
jgi:hypothetical protein